MADPTPSPCASVLVLGSSGSGRHALARELAQRLASAAVRIAVVEDSAALATAPLQPRVVLLLAPLHAAGEAEDLHWRDALARARLPFAVLHGSAAARLDAACSLVRAIAPAAPASQEGAAPQSAASWNWRCDKCSDPACEHRLFRDLVAARRPGAEPH